MAHKDTVSIDVSHLSCPICLDVPRDAIFMCSNGHNICSECVDQLPSPKNCPSCRLFYVPGNLLRNLSVEHMIAGLKGIAFKCRFTKWGCSTYSPRQSIEEHEKNCPFQPFTCPILYCENLTSRASFSAHLAGDLHKDNVINLGDLKTNEASFSYPIADFSPPFIPGSFCLNGVPFIYFWASHRNLSYLWVAVAGNESEAEKYSCEIALVNEHIGPPYTYKGPVHSIDKEIEYIARTCLGLPLTTDVGLRYQKGEPAKIKDGKKYPRLTFKITIRTNSPVIKR